MSFKTMLWAIEQRHLSPTEKVVLLDLAERSGEDQTCWPTVSTISARCNITDRTTTGILHKLRLYGLINIRQSQGRKSSTYVLDVKAKYNPVKFAGSDELDPEADAGNVRQTAIDPEIECTATVKSTALPIHTTEPVKGTCKRTCKEPRAGARSGIFEGRLEADFQEWWQAYPKRAGMDDARAAWANAVTMIEPRALLDATRAHRFPADPTYVPLPANWLSKRRWMDEQPGDGIDPVLAAAGLSRADLDPPQGKRRAAR
jgi:hypothetical protein